MTPNETLKIVASPQNILIAVAVGALCISGLIFLIRCGAKFISKLFAGSEESNIEVGNGLFKFSNKKAKPESSPDIIPFSQASMLTSNVTKNNIINCMTQSIDEVINYYAETNEIKNQLLKSQLNNTKRILNPISFTFTQRYRTELEKKNKDNPNFDIRYDDSSWFFAKLIELDFETIIMKELDDAYSRNHLLEKNEEDFQMYSNTIARRCVKALESSISNYRKPVDLIIARATFEDNRDELFRQINACIDDAKRQSEENHIQIINRNKDCNKKLCQIMTINIPDIQASDIGQIVSL